LYFSIYYSYFCYRVSKIFTQPVVVFVWLTKAKPWEFFKINKMLETLISSMTRIKLLLRLFLYPGTTAYLRGLAGEFDESTNSVRVELNRFEEANMLVSENKGNKKLYKANEKHPLFKDIHSILLKYIGVDKIINAIIERMGKLEK